jgi:hypothetical protein
MVITNALILRMSKMDAPMQDQVMKENPDANYALMINKCAELSRQREIDGKHEQAEKIEDLKFWAGVYLQKQRHKDAVVIEQVQ